MRHPPDLKAAGANAARPQVWAGVECSFIDLGTRPGNQLVATGHDQRDADIDLLASLGVTAARYPVLWGWPDGRRGTDWDWAARRLAALRERGIRPVVGLLHHGYGPRGVSPLDPGWGAAFAAYALEVARRFPEVDAYVPINEPLTTARFAGLYGWWPPYAASREVFVKLIVAQCVAIRDAMRQIRRLRPDAMLLVNEDGGKTYGTPELRDVIEFDNARRWLTFDLLTGRFDRGHRLWEYVTGVKSVRRQVESLRDDPQLPSVLGIDYYVTSDRWLDHRLDLYPASTRGGNGRVAYADVELARVDGDDVDGFGRSIGETWRRYGLPVALTEVDLAGHDADKAAWWLEAWRASCDAVAGGVAVEAVTAWSVLGAIDWSSMLRHDAGAYEPGAFDVRVSPPRRTSIGRLITSTALRTSMVAPAAAGWWRRPDRVLYRARAISTARPEPLPGSEARSRPSRPRRPVAESPRPTAP